LWFKLLSGFFILSHKENDMPNDTSLTERTCVPCRGDVPRLDINVAKEKLKSLDDWTLNDDSTRLIKIFYFDNFKDAQTFANKVGDLAEIEFHHPDITFGWGYCKIILQTQKIRGLHENDFILAEKTDQIL